MAEMMPDWSVPLLARALQAVEPALDVQVLPQVDSTNSALMRRVRGGSATPTLLVAEVQTAGRGRMGRQWRQGGAGAALAFSLALPLAPRDWSGLSLAVGVAVAESLDPAIRLKWPNDLWWRGRKLGGILIETAAAPGVAAPRWVVIGVGINVRPPPVDPGLSPQPASLQDLGCQAEAPALLQRVALPVLRAVRQFERDGFAPFAAGFEKRDALAGRQVQLSDGTRGVAAGVDAGGALCVQTGAGLQRVHSLEVSVRPEDVAASP